MILLLLFHRHREEFRAWLRTPATWWERVLASVACLVVFPIVGLLARFILGPIPLLPFGDLLRTVALWSGGFTAAAWVVAFFYPKHMLCVVYPFSLVEFQGNAS
jgi:hypothetical protein